MQNLVFIFLWSLPTHCGSSFSLGWLPGDSVIARARTVFKTNT